MAVIAEEYVIAVTGDDSGVKKMAESIKSTMGSLSSAIASFGVGVAGVFTGIGAAALAASKDINTAYRQIAIGTGAVNEELAGLKNTFNAVFAQVPASANDVAAALTTLKQLTGATGDSLEELAKTQLELAHITGAELKPQVEATTKAFNNWKIATDQQGPALDTLFRISQITGTSVTKLAEQMTSGGAAARAAGLSFEQSALLVGQLNKVGIDAQSIFNGFSIALRKIAQKGGDADPTAVLTDLIAKIKGAGSAAEANKIAVEAFGRSGIQMGEAIRSGRLNLEDLTKALAANKNTIGDTAEKFRTFGDIMEVFKNRVELALAPLGKEMTGILRSLTPDMDALVNVVKLLSDRFVALPDSAKQAAAGILVAFGVGGSIIAGLTAIVAILGGPVTLTLIAVGGIATALALDFVDGMQNGARATLTLKDALIDLAKVIGVILDIFGAAGHSIIAVFTIIQGIVTVTTDLMKGNFRDAGNDIIAATNAWTNQVAQAWEDLTGKWSGRLQELVGSAYDMVPQFAAAGGAAGAAWSKGAAQNLKFDPGLAAAHISGTAGTIPVGPAFGPGAQRVDTSALDAMTNTRAAALGSGAADKFLGSFAKKAGGGMSKVLVDVFNDGIAGLDAALAKIGSGAGLAGLFDPVTKQAKAGAEQLKNALDAVAKNVNDFLSTAGDKAKVTTATLAAHWQEFTGIIGKTDAFERLKDALNNLNLDRLNAGLTELDSIISISGNVISISIAAFEELRKKHNDVIQSVEKAGFTFKTVWPGINQTLIETKDVFSEAADEAEKATKTFDISLAQADKRFKDSEEVAAHWAGSIVDDAERLKQALGGTLAGAAGAAAAGLLRLRAELDIHSSIEGAIQEIERYGAEIKHLTGDALQEWVKQQSDTLLVKIPGITREGLQKALEEHQKAATQLPGIWNDVFNKMSAGAKSWAASIFGVLDSIPGAFGQAVKKTTDTISQWVNFFDKILGLLHKFVSAIPDSIGSAIGQISGIFKQTGTAASGMSHDIGGAFGSAAAAAGVGSSKIADATKGMSESTKTAFGVAGGAAAGFAMSLSLAANSSSKAMGFLQATISSTLAGIAAGFAFGPVAGAITAGVSLIGGIIGLFKGKSAAQKQQEALQLQQLKDQVAQDAQNIVNTALDGFNKALDFLNKLDDFTAARKANFRAFFVQLTKLMDWFVELSKAWGKDTLDKAKEFADSLGPVVDAITNAPAALENIGQYIPAASRSIDAFFNDLRIVLDKFTNLSESIANDLQKRARKFAERVLPVTDVIKGAVEGLAAIANFKDVPSDAMDAFGNGLRLAVIKMQQVADSLDQGGVKVAARFADRAGTITGILKGAVDGLAAVAGFASVPAEAFDVFFASIKAAMSGMSDLADQLDADALGKAVAIANAILPVAAAIKAWADAAGAVKGYTAVAAETWNQISADFNRALQLIDLMLGAAIDYLPKAQKFADTMTQLAGLLSSGLSSFSGGVTAAASQFGAVVGAIEGGVPFPGASGAGSVGAASFTPSSSSASAVTITSAPIIHVYPSAGMDEAALADLVAKKVAEAQAKTTGRSGLGLVSRMGFSAA